MKKRTYSKLSRVVSWALTLCLLAGMLPASVAGAPEPQDSLSAAAEQGGLRYNFNSVNPGSNYGDGIGAETFTDFSQTTSDASDPWKFFSDTSVFKYTKFITPAYGFLFSGGGPRQFMIQVPEGEQGSYQAEWVGTIYNNSTQTEIRLQPCDQDGNTSGEELLLGAFNPYHETDTLHHQTVELSECELQGRILYPDG